jgi:hypothetical protein
LELNQTPITREIENLKKQAFICKS